MKGLKIKFSRLGLVLAITGIFLFGNVGKVWGANIPAAATNATIYGDVTTLAGGENVGITNNGLAFLRGGLTISGGTAGVAFDCPLPIEGPLSLDNTTHPLYLISDLYLGNGSRLAASGDIVCTATNAIVLNTNFDLGSFTIDFIYESAVINGLGNVLDFSNGGGLTIAASKTLTLSNMILRGLQTGDISLGANSTLILDNVVIELGGTCDLDDANSHIVISGDVLVKGNGNTLQLSAGEMLFLAGTLPSLTFDVGTTFNVDIDAFTTVADAIFHLDGCTLDLAGASLTLETACLVLFENKVTIVGSGTLNVSTASTKVLGGARVLLTSNAVINI